MIIIKTLHKTYNKSQLRDFWCIIPFFNFENNGYFVRNLMEQIKIFQDINVPFIVIEAGYRGRFYLPDEKYIIKLPTNSILWQKERLIAYGATLAPDYAKYIMYMDSGMLFNRCLFGLAIKYLRCFDVVLIYNKCIHLNSNKTYSHTLSSQSVGGGQIFHRDKFHLYEYAIMGCGDSLSCNALISNINLSIPDFGFRSHHYLTWKKQIQKLNITFTSLPLSLLHLWHGDKSNRQYTTRDAVLFTHEYNPTTDVTIHNNVLEFTGNKPGLESDIRDFFYKRGLNTNVNN